MFAVDVCRLPETGGSTFVAVIGLLMLIVGLFVTRWVRQSAGRMSVVVAPLVLLGGLALAPSATDPCVPPTTVVSTSTTTVETTTTTTVAPTTTTTTVAPVLYSVGDPGPGGGTIFHVDMTRADGSRYFELACFGWQNNCDSSRDPLASWGCHGTAISGADGTAIGAGKQNTADIVAGCADVGIAAKLANDYTKNNFDDWYLPSKAELNELCKYVLNTGQMAGSDIVCRGSIPRREFSTYTVDNYWSSSEHDSNYASYQYIGTGISPRALKSDGTLHVRPVRSF